MLFLVSGDDNIKIVNVIDFMIFEIISQILKVKSTAHKIPFVYCTLYIVNNLVTSKHLLLSTRITILRTTAISLSANVTNFGYLLQQF